MPTLTGHPNKKSRKIDYPQGDKVWYDLIPFEEQKAFLREEKRFTRDELEAFYDQYDPRETEHLRRILLHKRRDFLYFWLGMKYD